LSGQCWTGSYQDRVAFAAASPRPTSYSGDRTQFLGRNGSLSKPAALSRTRLDNRIGAGFDPAVALQVQVAIDAGSQVDVFFLLGEAENVGEARKLVERYASGE